MVENPLGKEKVANLPEQTNLDIKVPLFRKMELTIKSLSEGAFTVKQDKKKWNVCFKRVIVVGGLFDENLAKNIAEEYNKITAKIKKNFQLSMVNAEMDVQRIYDGICRDVTTIVVQDLGLSVEDIERLKNDVGRTIFSKRSVGEKCQKEECCGRKLSSSNNCGEYNDISDCSKLREGKN